MLQAEWNDIVERVARELYNGKQSGNISPDMVRGHATELMQAITNGFGKGFDKPDLAPEDFNALRVMEKNIFHFSGAKNWNQLREMSALLLNEKKERKPFGQYLEDVRKIDKTYNVSYLRVEYEYATAASQSIAQWKKVEAEAELFPLIRIKCVMDARTRADHAIMHNMVFRYDSTILKHRLPPFDFGCRCWFEQLEEGEAELTDIHESDLPVIPEMFRRNVGIEGTAFSEKHPYFTSIPPNKADDVKAEAEKLIPERKHGLSQTTVIKARSVKTEVTEALNIVDDVLTLPDMGALTVETTSDKTVHGFYHPMKRLIAINRQGDHIQLTTLHELSHMIDLRAYANKGGYESRQYDNKVGKILDVLNNSDSVKNLRSMLASGSYMLHGEKRPLSLSQLKYIKYLLDPAEIWARSLSQYFAHKSEKKHILEQVDKLANRPIGNQWKDEDFKTAILAFDEHFNELGWLNKKK